MNDNTVKKLTLHFPNGENSSICDKIARYADSICRSSVSSGGYEITRFPVAKGDEKIEFSYNSMEYDFEYLKDRT